MLVCISTTASNRGIEEHASCFFLCLNERVCGSRFRSADPTERMVLSSVAILIEQDRMAACYCSNEGSTRPTVYISPLYRAAGYGNDAVFSLDFFPFCLSSSFLPLHDRSNPRSRSFLVNTKAHYPVEEAVS